MKSSIATCVYLCTCLKDGCNQVVDFTDIIVKDVLVTGLADDDIRKELLGWAILDEKDINETISFIEAKEMARYAIDQPAVNGSVSSLYKSIKIKP